jgi:Phage capsid family
MTRNRKIALRPDYKTDLAVRSLARAVISIAIETINRSDLNYAGSAWPNDDDADLIARGTSLPLSTATTIISPVTIAFITSLIPLSAGAALLSKGISLNFAGAGAISVPNISSIMAEWVGELQAIPAKSGATTPGATLTPNKLAVIVSLTDEMVRHSNAEAVVTQVLSESVAPAIDASLFSNAAAVPDLRPAGLLNGITALTPSTATPSSVAMVEDLSTLAGSVAPFAGNGGIVFVASARQAVAINLLAERMPYSVLASASLAPGTVIAVATPAIVSASELLPRIDASPYALIHEETNAQAIVLPGGGTASPVRSLYQTDSVAMRLRLPISWALRQPGALAWMQNVSW